MNRDDGAAFVAAIAEPQERVIGMVLYRIDPQNPTIAQPAILIEDQFQGKGVGGVLMRHLCEHAVLNGIQVFDAVIHPANRRAMRLFKQSGLALETKLAYGSF